MSLLYTVSTSKFERKNAYNKKQYTFAKSRILNKNKGRMVRRAKMFHRYRNRTGRLTRGTRGRVDLKKSLVVLYNSVFYAMYVQGYTNNKFLLNAINYYRKDLKKEIQNIPKRFFKR